MLYTEDILVWDEMINIMQEVKMSDFIVLYLPADVKQDARPPDFLAEQKYRKRQYSNTLNNTDYSVA